MQTRKSYHLKIVILAAVLIAAVLISIVIGRYSVSLGDMAKILHSEFTGFLIRLENWFSQHLHIDPGWDLQYPEPDWQQGADKVLLEIRLPRIAAALLIGAALSTAGCVYQGMFRNPMVSPDILGASTGAGFGAALSIMLGAGYFTISAVSFCFGMIAVMLAYTVSRISRANETIALILAGMIVSSLFSSGVSFIKLVADTQEQLPAITYWLMGSLSSIKVKDVNFIFWPIIIGLTPLLLLRWRMNLLTVEEESAVTMGVNTRILRFVVVICATLLTAASVAVSGMIGWTGLVIPHFCRMIFGYDYRRLIPASVLFGASFLLIVDDVARIATTAEIPLGILTSFIGAPLFLYLLVTGGGRAEQ